MSVIVNIPKNEFSYTFERSNSIWNSCLFKMSSHEIPLDYFLIGSTKVGPQKILGFEDRRNIPFVRCLDNEDMYNDEFLFFG